MKKVMTKVFVAAAVLAGTNVLSSCKDYDEDKFYEYTVSGEKQNADLKEYVDQQDKALNALIEQLQKAQDDCKANCQAKFTELNNLIVQLQEKDAELKNLIDTKADQSQVDALNTTVEGIKTQISTIISDIATLQTNVTTIQNDITLINQTLENLKPRVEKNEQDIATLQSDVNTINNTIITIKSDVATLQGDVASLKSAVETINQTLVVYDTRITQAQQTASDALALANSNKTYIQNVETALNEYKAQTNDRLDNLEAAVADLQDQIDELAETAAKNFQTAIAIAKQLDAELKAEMLQAIADAIADYDANLQQQLIQMAENIKNDYEAADAALKSELVQQIADAKQEVLDILNPKIEDLQNQIDALVQKDADLQQQIDDLKDQVDQNKQDILANTQKIDDLTGRVTDLENAINSMVTGITVQGTYNPAFGTFALPVGIQSNILMAFVGKTTEDVSFPTVQTGNYVYADQALTAAEARMIGSAMDSYTKKGGKDLLSNADDNAGTLYVTVNPNTVDFTGATLKLENSQGVSAGIDLSPLAKSDETLTFGYTRAANNGFYEAKAKINNLDAVQKINIDKSKFKDAAKELINEHSINFTEISSAIYDELNGFLDANAAVATYTDAYGEHSVYSQYNLAATAIHPLSYAFAKDFSGRSTLPGYERVENFIDRAANAINSRIGSAFNRIYTSGLYQDLPNVTINHITIKDLEETSLDLDQFKFEFNINKTFDLGGKTITFNIDKNIELPLQFSATADLSGINFTLPSIVVDGTGQIAQVIIPVFEDMNDNGVYDEGIDHKVLGPDGEPMYSVFPATNVTVSGSTEAGATVTMPNGTTATININQTINTHLTLSDLEFTIPNDGTFSFTVDETFSKDLTGAIKDLWAIVQSEVGSVNSMLDQFQDLLNDANAMLDDIKDFEDSLTSAVDNVADRLKSYLERINNKVISLIDGAIARLQPCLIISTPQGSTIGRNIISQATTVNTTEVTLIPTSYTAELITPAFKKHVACVNVFKNGTDAQNNDADCKAELNRVNGQENMNTVINGAEKFLKLNLKSGYTYQFAYSALDYSGKICVKRACVRVK